MPDVTDLMVDVDQARSAKKSTVISSSSLCKTLKDFEQSNYAVVVE